MFVLKKKRVLTVKPSWRIDLGLMTGVTFCLILHNAYVISGSRCAVLKETIIHKIKTVFLNLDIKRKSNYRILNMQIRNAIKSQLTTIQSLIMILKMNCLAFLVKSGIFPFGVALAQSPRCSRGLFEPFSPAKPAKHWRAGGWRNLTGPCVSDEAAQWHTD